LKNHFFDRDGGNAEHGNFIEGNLWQHEMMNLANQTAPEMDLFVSDAIRNTLFTNVQGRPEDLVARNIQRGRDHGIPGYAKLRGACGMADIVGREAPAEINADDWGKLMKTYNNDPSLIDPFTAGLAETAPADGMVGPLFACIIKRQFEKLRDGDRFFFSHRRSRLPSSPQAFSQGLQPIAKGNIQGRSLGAVICDNLDDDVFESYNFHRTIGREVFRTPDSATNPRLDCRKLKPGNGTLDLSRIFDEAVSKPDGLSSILEKDVVEEVSEERSIQSINYPLNYLDNIDEEDKLEVNEGFVVELTFEFFQLEKDNSTSGQCRFDYVEILESNGKGVKLCGDDVRSGQKFHSEGKEMTVRFHSDESITKKGFKATWKEVPK